MVVEKKNKMVVRSKNAIVVIKKRDGVNICAVGTPYDSDTSICVLCADGYVFTLGNDKVLVASASTSGGQNQDKMRGDLCQIRKKQAHSGRRSRCMFGRGHLGHGSQDFQRRDTGEGRRRNRYIVYIYPGNPPKPPKSVYII